MVLTVEVGCGPEPQATWDDGSGVVTLECMEMQLPENLIDGNDRWMFIDAADDRLLVSRHVYDSLFRLDQYRVNASTVPALSLETVIRPETTASLSSPNLVKAGDALVVGFSEHTGTEDRKWVIRDGSAYQVPSQFRPSNVSLSANRSGRVVATVTESASDGGTWVQGYELADMGFALTGNQLGGYSVPANSATWPTTAMRADGEVVAAWSEIDPTFTRARVFVGALAASPDQVTQPVPDNAPVSTTVAPSLAVTEGGRMVVAWSEPSGIAVSERVGTSWSPSVTLVLGDGEKYSPGDVRVVAIEEEVFALWTGRVVNGSVVNISRIDEGGRPTFIRTFARAPSADSQYLNAELLHDARGHVTLVWVEWKNLSGSLHAAPFRGPNGICPP